MPAQSPIPRDLRDGAGTAGASETACGSPKNEGGRITPRAHRDHDCIRLTLCRIVSLQASAKPADFSANRGIDARVERSRPLKHVERNRVFVHLRSAAFDRGLDEIPQELAFS